MKTKVIEESIKKVIRNSCEYFLKEYKMDIIDQNIVDNYTDYIINDIEQFFEKINEGINNGITRSR